MMMIRLQLIIRDHNRMNCSRDLADFGRLAAIIIGAMFSRSLNPIDLTGRSD
jgi:hypothetical protein